MALYVNVDPSHMIIPGLVVVARPVMRLSCLVALFSVGALALTPSSVTLTASPNPSSYGQAVTLTAAVTPGATGKVTYYDGVTILTEDLRVHRLL